MEKVFYCNKCGEYRRTKICPKCKSKCLEFKILDLD